MHLITDQSLVHNYAKMDEIPVVTQGQLHPNWVGLSTSNIKYKKFVKATDSEFCSVRNKSQQNSTVEDGALIRAFYDETISDKKSLKEKSCSDSVKSEVVCLSDSADSDIEEVDIDVNKKMLVAIQNSDLNTLKSLKGCDFNLTDEFGWTALEIACVIGQVEIVNFIKNRGGNIKNKDKIFRILIERGFDDVVSSLNHDANGVIEVVEIKDNNQERCDICGEMFDADLKKLHMSKITHQLSVKRMIKRNPGFVLNESSLGFQMMKKSGWDGVSGLGIHQCGKLFPVKTSLKKDRKGLNIGDRKHMRITHFGPMDVRSIERRGTKRKRLESKGKSKPKKDSIGNSFDHSLRVDLNDL